MNLKKLYLIVIFISGLISSAYGAGLTSIAVTPGNNSAGEATIYTFNFTTSATGNGVDLGIPADGKIVITFPAGFSVADAEIAQTTDSGTMDGGFIVSSVGSIMTLVRDGTGSPVSTSTAVGVKVALITNHQAAASYTVDIETQLNDGTQIDSGTSPAFTIIHNSLASFQFNSIATQTAGTAFSITITALDEYGNQVTSFTGTASLSDLTGTISPTTTTNFSAGSWIGDVQVTGAVTNNVITVSALNKSGTSNQFDVSSASLDHFSFQTISSPQTAGTAFSITITAADAYNNIVTSFSDVVTLSDSTGTISPTTTGAFSSGQWSGDVIITQKQDDVAIIATYGAITGRSNLFNIRADDVDHFSVNTISSQTAGIPFIVEVYARDQHNNLVDSFSETVNISDATGTITPTVSDAFENGYWSGDVTITQAQTGNIISVVRTSTGVESGASNSFDVQPNTLDHFSFNSIASPQTAGVSFSITITAMDGFGNTVTSFSGTASLSDLTGTLDPVVTGSFVNGVWSGNVTVTQSQAANTITVVSGSKTGTSNNFDVDPQAVDHFRFQNVASPQTAGQAFTVTITAEDEYNNRVTGFNNTVNLSDGTGTLSPSSVVMSSGQWSGTVEIYKSQNDVTITASWNAALGQSNAFNVESSVLDHFSITNIGTQAANEPFTITVTAQDFYDNRVTSFTGTVDIADLTGTISPSSSSAFDMGQWSGTVTIAQVRSNDQITVTRTGGGPSGNSNLFDVVAGNIDHFDVSAIADPQTAGVAFSVTITAKDASGATVTGYTGTANINDLTGTISPTVTTNFVGGVWTGDLTITKSYANNKVTVSGAGKSGTSNLFDVQANSAHHFTFETITSPKTAGTAFSVAIQARDQWENIATSFTSTANLSDNTGTISPAATTSFTNGQWTGNVTITKAQNDVEITATQATITGTSNRFNMQAASLDHFVISNISSQWANEPFSITITAQDVYANVAEQFTGKVDISDKTGTITPVESGSFTNGIWTGNVTISQSYTGNSITVQNQVGTEVGTSNNFDVISGEVDHFVVSVIGNQEAGIPFAITIRAEDSANNLVESFTGSAELSDQTGTLNPQTTGAFVGGQWTGNVTITKSFTNNKIFVTSGGKAGSSNEFDVIHSDLDHFTFQTISSPQTAGTPFQITIYAEDVYNNRVISFNTTVSLSDGTGTITPATTTSFINGSWTGNVTITKSQTDVKITATQNGKQGESNIFNINPGALYSFQIDNIGTQTAGELFSIRVTALDENGNVATQFTGTVDIADLSGTISPTQSGSFTNGQWTGNVSVSQTYPNNRITVTRTSGSESGQSNFFDVVSSSVDHFVFAAISGDQTAGTPFSITITAKDADENTVVSFTGTVTLTDLTGTLTPTTTTNFIGGVWTGNVKITKTWQNDKIRAIGIGKYGESNQFNVVAGEVDHFVFENIPSPQVAGQPFNISIIAKDSMNNTVTNYSFNANLTDNTGTISPSATANFVNGQWTGAVTITKKQNDVFITASRFGTTGQSNYFNVNAGPLAYLKVMNAAGGTGQEIGAIAMTLDDKLTLYAAGFDSYGNYARDVTATWGATGTLDAPQPTVGQYTIFDPVTPGTDGKIYADTTGLSADTTGTITVGSISYVKIRTAPGGAGVELHNATITADENLPLFCAGYDVGNNYIGDVSVHWISTGDLQPVINDTGSVVNFLPTRAPASGRIIADHTFAIDDSTGLITVVPGVPVGNIALTSSPSVIPADGTSSSVISSSPVLDADGNAVAKNTQFTVRTTLGTITSTDVNLTLPEIQVAADDSGKIQFTLQSSTAGGTAYISVSSVDGSANGYTSVQISSLNIVSVSSSSQLVSQGQQDIPVNMTVQNQGSNTITNLSAGLIFTGPAPNYENRNSDFPGVIRNDAIIDIPSGSTRSLSFLVDVSQTAANDTVTIDGWISGLVNGVSVSDTFAVSGWKWKVQTPANLKISRVHSLISEVTQGRTGITVSMDVINSGEAEANVVLDTLRFWSMNHSLDVTNEYERIPSPDNPITIPGGSGTTQLNFTVNVGTAATLGQTLVNGAIVAADANSGTQITDNSADTTLLWTVKSAPIVGIKGFYPSQLQVTKNQTVPWELKMVVENNGGTAVRLDSTRISFFLRGNDVTSEYGVLTPTKFMVSDNNILTEQSSDTLVYTINKTGNSIGEITIRGIIYLKDFGTNNPIVDEALTGVKVQEPAQLKIVSLTPSQNSVTRDQEQDWTIKVAVLNDGGTDILIDTLSTNTFISFSTGTDFVVNQPASLGTGDLLLTAGTTDTLTFVVDRTGMTTGNSYLSAQVTGYQTTSGDTTVATFTRANPLLVQEPALLRILSVVNQAPNPPTVNTGQVFPIRVILENNGQDEVKSATVEMSSSGNSISGTLALSFTDIPGNGGKREQLFNITAAGETVPAEIFTANIISAEAENTSETMGIVLQPSVDSTEIVTIQQPATFEIVNIVVPAEIRASQVNPWQIKVAITNSGEANAVIAAPSNDDVTIIVNNKVQNDYIINAPTELAGGGLILSSGVVDTLIYTVISTGEDAGAGKVEVELTANDQNDQQLLNVHQNQDLFVRSTAAVQLFKTKPICFNYDGEKGLVNRGQVFRVRVLVQNLGRKRVSDVVVRLTTSGQSVIDENQKTISFIEHNEIDSTEFVVTADPNNVTVNEIFTSEIISAIEYDSGLPADIDNSGDNTARIAVRDSAKLKVVTWTETHDSVYTIDQVFKIKAKVSNEGTAPVDESGQLGLFVPDNYRIIVGDDTLTNNNVISFYPEITYEWQVLTPEVASGPDSLRISILLAPLDKNINQRAQLLKPYATVVVRTEATNILYATSITDPPGATDRILSTQQDFTVQTIIQFSQNLDNVSATLKLPRGEPAYHFISLADSSQPAQSLVPIKWSLKAPDDADSDFRKLYMIIQANEEGNPIPLVYKDSIEVKTVHRAELELSAKISYPEGAQDGKVSTGQLFEVKAEVKNNGTAHVYGNGYLEINLGSTGCQFADTSETAIKAFKVDTTAVTWNLVAPTQPTSRSEIIVSYFDNNIPKDENTNETAWYDRKKDKARIFVTTEQGGNISVAANIQGPAGAVDGIVSSYQEFDIIAHINSSGVSNLKSQLLLPKNFSFYPNVNPIQPGESSVQWRIVAPSDSVSNAVLKIVTSGNDLNNDTLVVYSDTSRIVLDVVRRAEAEVVAEIIAPAAATDGIVSLNQQFVVQAYLANYGQANFEGQFKLQLKLPDNYFTEEDSIKTAVGSETVQWNIQAPAHTVLAKTIEVRVPPGEGPRDENSWQEVHFWQENRSDHITITTTEKTVKITKVQNRAHNTAAYGQANVPILAMQFFNPKDDEFTNNVILSGLKVTLKDRLGNKIENPGQVISRIAACDYNRPEVVYGAVTSFSDGANVTINFTQPDTIYPDLPDTLDIVVDIKQAPDVKTLLVSIDSDTNIFIKEELTANTPKLEGEVSGQSLVLTSDFIVIKGNNLEESFGNYPNPFGSSGRPKTTITYYLKEDTDVSIKIYTLIGELVWSRTFSANDPEGKQGMHDGDVTWDARNDDGHKVLNGVYVIYFKTGYGETAITKAAVIK